MVELHDLPFISLAWLGILSTPRRSLHVLPKRPICALNDMDLDNPPRRGVTILTWLPTWLFLSSDFLCDEYPVLWWGLVSMLSLMRVHASNAGIVSVAAVPAILCATPRNSSSP